MSKKVKLVLNIILNVFMLAIITSMTYSWMLTQSSQGELVDYNRNLVITSSEITVEAYAYKNGQYEVQTTSPMYIGLMAPGVNQKYRFDITNTKSVVAVTKVIFSGITGDINILKPYIIMGSTSPESFSFLLTDKIQYNATANRYYVDFINEFRVPANQTISLYCYLSLPETATNDIANKSITIDKIIFIKP